MQLCATYTDRRSSTWLLGFLISDAMFHYTLCIYTYVNLFTFHRGFPLTHYICNNSSLSLLQMKLSLSFSHLHTLAQGFYSCNFQWKWLWWCEIEGINILTCFRVELARAGTPEEPLPVSEPEFVAGLCIPQERSRYDWCLLGLFIFFSCFYLGTKIRPGFPHHFSILEQG